jgi:hypothetical protein
MKSANKYYVYIYLDPRIKSSVDGYDYEPFYVGKGKKYRYKVHLQEAIRGWDGSNTEKMEKIRSILQSGNKPIIIVSEKMEEFDALSEEIRLIKKIGRKDKNKGPLLNITDGGDTPININENSRKKMSDAKIGTHLSEKTKKRMRDAHLGKKNHFYGKSHSGKTKRLISLHRRGKLMGKDHPMFGKTHTRDARQKISDSKKKLIGEKNPKSKRYELISPSGEVFFFSGGFDRNCKKLGIKSPVLLRHVAQGIRKTYQGWKCRYI